MRRVESVILTKQPIAVVGARGSASGRGGVSRLGGLLFWGMGGFGEDRLLRIGLRVEHGPGR